MKNEDKDAIIQLYESRLKEIGENIKTLGWKDKEQQELRFSILVDIGDLRGSKILYVGCGFGDLYDYLIRKGTNVRYTGFDISSGMIEVAKKRHPDLTFEVRDILIDDIDDRFDFIFASGILNKHISDNMTYAREIIKKMFDLCSIGTAINMTTDYVDYKEDYLYYYSPEKIFKYCKTLSRYVTLRHDYPLYEFTAYIFKEK